MQGRRRSLTATLSTIGLFALGDAGGMASAGRAHAAGDRALGEYLSAECATCHQISGRQQGGIPAIVGHPADQFVALMESYKDKHRDSQVMRTIAGRLSREEIEALATYYEILPPQS
ncbi:c-type cytochrome [Bosea sp. 124]|uniref:c-type cytochrome n=1 Tax=Bosea sp. 124 TaxID=2135642 RepID=UPI000D33AE46|nr:c-type cytochrome [Bosea sp. 124]PTM43494.1 cytochrome c553 [Bosea sp. 124]